MKKVYERKPNTECFVCKAKIYRRPFEIKKGGVFCGPSCYGKFQRKDTPCLFCGTLIRSGLNKKTCNRVCSNKSRAGIKYKIGSPKDKVRLQGRLKMRLFSLRGIKCERCDYSKKEVIQVHHINRDRSNSNLSNLELLCPNCHYEEHSLEKK